MSYRPTDDLTNRISTSFTGLPIEKILACAHDTQREILSGSLTVTEKTKQDFVTRADVEIQNLLLDHFASSPLQGLYRIQAEEQLTPEQQRQGADDTHDVPFSLLIDPLDGTNAFCRGESTWGTMVGITDRNGRFLHSWTLLSNGHVFSTHKDLSSAIPDSSPLEWPESSSRDCPLLLDVYDYGSGARMHFSERLAASSNGRYTASCIHTTCYPAACWAGWELYNNRLHGLLWFPNDDQNRFYPSYDLIFLGALRAQGWSVTVGMREGLAKLVAVAPSEEQLALLLSVAHHDQRDTPKSAPLTFIRV